MATNTRSATVRLDDARRLLRLALDLRDLPAGSVDQRRHAVVGIAALVGAQVGMWLEMEVTPAHGLGLRTVVDVGWESEAKRQAFVAYTEGVHTPEEIDPSLARLGPALAAGRTALRRQDLVEDRDWYRNEHVQRYRREGGVDAFVALSRHAPGGAMTTAVSLHRPWGDRQFSEREQNLVALFQSECTFLFEPPPLVPLELLGGLAPRLRDTLLGLAAGKSEKQLAADLGLSPHTVHEYVKALHRHFGVKSRGELLGLCLGTRPR